MSDGEAQCYQCGTPVSYDTGFTITGGLADSSQDRIWCTQHAPARGKGWTLSDLQRMREDAQAERAKREMALMDLVGTDVYFAVKGSGDTASPLKRLLDSNQRIYAKLREIGAIEDQAP